MDAARNPFRSQCIDRLPFRPQGLTLDDLQARLQALGERALIVGPEGSGKTTWLEDLERTYRATGRPVRRFRLAFGQRFVAPEIRAAIRVARRQPGPEPTVWLVDSLEQLSLPGWWQLRHAIGDGPLIATSHTPGRLPTWFTTQTSPALLRELVATLLAGAGTMPRQSPDIDDATLDALYATHRGDIRQCFRQLYLRFADHGASGVPASSSSSSAMGSTSGSA